MRRPGSNSGPFAYLGFMKRDLFGRERTDGERAALSPGLARALDGGGARPCLIGAPSRLARIAALWRGQVPIMALGDRIFWPGVADDLSRAGGEHAMAVLQHELQHVLEYAEGRLTLWRYALDPRNWTYRYRLDARARWGRLGAEQRAAIVEELFRLERDPAATPERLAICRRLVPWAGDEG